MRYSFDDAHAPTTKKRQYYAMLGTRGIWQDGWKAAATARADQRQGAFDQDRWELYHVDVDRSESRTSPRSTRRSCKELIKAWFEEADANFVLPLDDRPRDRGSQRPPPPGRAAPLPVRLLPGHDAGARRRAVNIRGRSYKILADVEVTADPGGHLRAWFALRRPHPVHQGPQTPLRVQLPRHQTRADVRLGTAAGQLTLGVEFVRESAGEYLESIGTAKCMSDEKVVAKGPMRRRSASSRCPVTGCASASTAPTR